MKNWTVSKKLTGLIGVSLCSVVGLGTASYYGYVQSKTSLDDILVSTNALKHALMGDMMHDALRADVFSALLAKSPEC
jgi:methyl-accepting chemotaxis protein